MEQNPFLRKESVPYRKADYLEKNLLICFIITKHLTIMSHFTRAVFKSHSRVSHVIDLVVKTTTKCATRTRVV